ncbi:MAG: DsbA family oxidoreductase [Geminicoccaceae bacterium]
MPDDAATAIDIEVIADIACPWCHIGLARLAKARAACPARPTRVRWWPFFLNPNLPPEGMDRATYLNAKFGGRAAAARVYERIRESGRLEGIDFDFARMRRTPNTLAAHRLILHAEEQGSAEPLIEGLFRALFQEGRDIGRHQELIDLAGAAGLARAETARLLKGERYAREVRALHLRAERIGVRGVPVFAIDRKHAIAGAQPPEVLSGLIDLAVRARAEGEAASTPKRSASGALSRA